MKTTHPRSLTPTAGLAALLVAASFSPCALAFEGRIESTLTRGGETQTVRYTVGPTQLRIERAETNWPHAKNIVARDSGAVTLVFPHNRSFVRLQHAAAGAPPAGEGGGLAPGFAPGAPVVMDPHDPLPPGRMPGSTAGRMPAATPIVGPTNLAGVPPLPPMPQLPAGIGAPAGAGLGALPAMPMLPMEPLALKATGERTNLLGCACARYELRQRGEVMEIWATDQLFPFHAWMPNQRPRVGPRLLESQWAGLLCANKLFPLRAVLKFENGPERFRFEVTVVSPGPILDEDGRLFQPPPDYHETQPLPF